MPRYLRINGTESWRLEKDADAETIQASLCNAMETGGVVEVSVVPLMDSPRALIVNGKNLVTAIITEGDYHPEPEYS